MGSGLEYRNLEMHWVNPQTSLWDSGLTITHCHRYSDLPHTQPAAIYALPTVSCPTLLNSKKKPCFPCHILSIFSWLWVSCHGNWLWLRTKINPLSLEIISFMIVALLSSVRPAFFFSCDVLAFHERVFIGLHAVPVPLCNQLDIFMSLVITFR